MQIVEIITTLPIEQHEQLAMNVAVDRGFNCYSKSVANKDETTDDSSIYYYKWKGRTLKVVITKKPIDEQNNTKDERTVA